MQQRLGRYELVEVIASGGQGTVWRSQDTVLDRIVAIKVLNQPVAGDPRYLEALQREARLAAGLVHPNITAVHDFQVEGDIAYIVMEYVPDTLSSHMQNGQPFAYQRAVEIAIQICRALSHAHAQEIIHRDIKLQNILLTEEGNVKVSDFGIARALASSTRSSATSTMGTPFYMSPEQWGGARIDGRADIYSLGILLYEMLTGSVPFRAENIGAMYVQHRESAIPEISSELGIPDAVEAVMRMALAKDPESRFASADAMANALQRSLNPHTIPEQPVSTPAPPREPMTTSALQLQPTSNRQEAGFNPRWWLIFGGVGAVGLVVAIVALMLLNSSDGVASWASGELMVLYSQAESNYEEQKYQLAIQDYSNIINVFPDEAPAYNNRAVLYRYLGQYENAIQDYDKVIDLDAQNSRAYNNRGIAYRSMGQYQRAIRDYTAALLLTPGDADYYYNRAVSYGFLDQPDKADDDYNSACSFKEQFCK